MPKPKKVKATGFKKSGYSNTSKSNNTSYVSSKDKLYSKATYLIYSVLDICELCRYIKSDFNRLKKYFPNINK